MKKVLLLVSAWMLVLNFIIAKDVDLALAELVANNYFSHQVLKQASNLKQINLNLVYTEKNSKGSPVYFIFNNDSNNGFIIISGDDAVTPVLGYSTKGNYDAKKIHPNFIKWMDALKKEINYAKTNNLLPDTKTQISWKSIKTNNFSKTENQKSVDPLVTVIWGQDPYVNEKCPYDEKEAKNCVTGCPATAMAQIMKYWNHPVQGTGYHSYQHPDYGTLSVNFGNTNYDWANMPDDVTESNDAVATLMSHCGIACDMQYSPNSSGAFILEDSPTPEANCEYAYKHYFGYDDSVQGLYKDDYTESDWIDILKTELDEGRPMQYAGFGGGGHTFVCDGYDDNDMFHMNWGWNGVLNGFYALNALSPGVGGTGAGEGTYNEGQQAIIGIKPKPGTLSSAPIFGLKLGSSINLTPSSIQIGSPFSGQVDVGYLGAADLKTDIAVLLFTEDGVFIDYVDYLPGQTFQSGLTNTISFSTNGITTIPGKHTIGIYSSMESDSVWHLINKAGFINPLVINISGPNNDVRLGSDINFSENPLIVNKSFYISASVTNQGLLDFNGNVVADIFNSNGEFIQTLDELTNVSIPAGETVSGLLFNSSGLSIEPGSYYVALFNSSDLVNYTILSNEFYTNPILIDLVDPPLVEDIYENNNNTSNAFNLPMNFVLDVADINTTGSNIHVGEDIDHYKIILDPGYDYSINARVHDQFNSDNGNTYSCDVYFTYNDGSGESEYFDDVNPNDILINGAGSIDFKVSPFYVGFTGDYDLEIKVSRTLKVNTIESQLSESVLLFPVPASNSISISNKNSNINVEQFIIKNNLGQVVKVVPNIGLSSNEYQIDVPDFSNGIYFIQIQFENQLIINKKFIINH